MIHDFQKYRLQRQQQLNQATQHHHHQQQQQNDDTSCNYTEIYAEIPDTTSHGTTNADENNDDDVFTKDNRPQIDKDKSAIDRYYDSVSQLLLKRPQLHNPRAYQSTKLPQLKLSYNYHQRHSTSQQQKQQQQRRQRLNSDETQGHVHQQLHIQHRHRQQQQKQQQQQMKNYRDGKPFKTNYSDPRRSANNDNNNRIQHGGDDNN